MTCWYCAVRNSEDKHAYNVDMYGGVAASATGSETNVAYHVRHIVIPRCADCHGKHKTAKFFSFLSVLLILLTVASLIALLFNLLNTTLAGILLGFFAGLFIAALLAGKMVQKGIFSVSDGKSKFPEIVELLKDCYRFGIRPNKKLPVSDPPCGPGEAAQ